MRTALPLIPGMAALITCLHVSGIALWDIIPERQDQRQSHKQGLRLNPVLACDRPTGKDSLNGNLHGKGKGTLLRERAWAHADARASVTFGNA